MSPISSDIILAIKRCILPEVCYFKINFHFRFETGLACSHAFHYECILPWLIKGKKRCPICRDWFVPGEKIEDQKNELQRRIDQESISQNEESDNVIIEVYEPEAEPEAEDASNGEDFVRREEQNPSEEEEAQVLSA